MARATVYLPKTANDYRAALQHIKLEFAESFGGFTSYGEGVDGVVGGWVNPEGDLIEEPVVVVESYDSGTTQSPHSVASAVARDVKDITDETSVMYAVNGDATFA